jgi:AraC-like DNA-binding protein
VDPRRLNRSGATLNAVFYPRTAAEVLALDILHRSGWQPVAQDAVTQWSDDRSRHSPACPCWRCEAAARSTADQVWRRLRGWRQRRAAAPVAGIDDRRPLPEQARTLRDAGLTMAEIAAELGCAPSTVHRVLHNA